MSGVLKAKVGGSWVNIIGSGMSAETARWNSAWGVVATARVITSQSGITSAVAVTGATVTVTTVAGRRYRIEATAHPWSPDAANIYVQFALGRNAVRLNVRNFPLPTSGYNTGVVIDAIDVPGAGTNTYNMTVARLGGGTVNNSASDTEPTELTVFDEGPVIYNAAPPTSNPTGIPAFYGRMAVGSVINIPNTPTRFACVDVVRNNAAMLDTGTGHVVIPKTGWYSAEAHLYANYNGATPSTWLQIELRVGDVSDHQHNLRREFYVGGIAAVANFTATGVAFYTAGDRIGFWMAQNSGANVTPYSSASTAQSTSIKFAYLGAD